jgi:hypothetical protein
VSKLLFRFNPHYTYISFKIILTLLLLTRIIERR